jgi:DNA-binding transcriptional regulator YdaS (Cro superfamily)
MVSTLDDKNIFARVVRMSTHGMITKREILDLFKSQAQLAKLLKLTRSAIHEWTTSNRPVPAEYVLRISKYTGLKPRQIRPDLWPSPVEPTLENIRNRLASND